jgi:hypothetical protein
VAPFVGMNGTRTQSQAEDPSALHDSIQKGISVTPSSRVTRRSPPSAAAWEKSKSAPRRTETWYSLSSWPAGFGTTTARR